MQEFLIPEQERKGPAGVATLELISDMQQKITDHYFAVSIGYPYKPLSFVPYRFVESTADAKWKLESIPKNPDVLKKCILTASRSGLFVGAETEQANVRNMVWQLENDPLLIVSTWQWIGRPIVTDAWAWVHCVHFMWGLDELMDMFVLFLVVRRNARVKKVWVGDAFVSISRTLTSRAFVILLMWYINGFWTLTEFAYHHATTFRPYQTVFLYPEMIHANLLTLYFGIIGLIGNCLKERIDPALALFLFEYGFSERHTITSWFKPIGDRLMALGKESQELGIVSRKHSRGELSPLSGKTIYELRRLQMELLAYSLFPVVFVLLAIIVYILGRKIYRWLNPERIVVQRVTGYSEDESSILSQKRNLTIFEVATGAALQNRYGLVSDYDTCVYIKGMKYASTDGIYCNGFVICNNKFLIAADDVKYVAMIKAMGVRLTNVYVYEVDGSTVKHTAQIVYPDTMTWYDISHLNISILS